MKKAFSLTLWVLSLLTWIIVASAPPTALAVTGDLNNDGAVNVFDALLTLQYAVGLIEHTPENIAKYLAAADVAPLDATGKPKGDGTVNVFDALAILRHAVNLDTWIPVQAIGTVGSGGGTIEVTNASSPINGTKVVVPDGALDSGDQVTISIDYTDKLPASITTHDPETIAVSKVILLTKNSSYDFKVPIDVTIPYTDTSLQTGDIPVVAYWDEAAKKYFPVSVKAIDRTNKLLTFTTIHFTPYIALGIPGMAVAAQLSSLAPKDTGFYPDVDGFFHPNSNIYDVGLGACVGMSSYAAWYFTEKKAADGTGLYNKYRQGNPGSYLDDIIARELLTRTALASSQTWAGILGAVNLISPFEAGMQILSAMRIFHAPQVMVFNYRPLSRHAVTVYRYDATNRQFNIYDNNYPGQVVTVDWSPTWGLSNYSHPPPDTLAIGNYTFEAIPTFFKNQDFENFYAGAAASWSGGKFNFINITSPVLDANSSATVSPLATENVTVQGTVSGGERPAKYLAYKVIKVISGAPGRIEASGVLNLTANGTFSFPRIYTSGLYWIIFLATDDAKDASRFKPHAYAGLKEMYMTVNALSVPTIVGSLSLPSPALNVQVAGNLAYIRDSQKGLRIADVSTPASPTMKGVADISYNSTGKGIAVNGQYAYVGSGAFYIVDVSNPMSPVKTAGQGFNANAGDLVVSGNYAYVAAGRYTYVSTGLFAIADITEPTKDKNRFVGGLEFPGGNIRAIALAGSYAYLVDTSNSKMYVVSISDPQNPVKKSEVKLPSLVANSDCGIFLSGDKAFIADADGYSIITISNPEAPSVIINRSTADYLKDVWVVGTKAYLLGTYKLFVYDVTDPAKPQFTTSVDLPASTYGTGLFISGNLAYVTQGTSDSKGLLTIIDIGN